MDGGACERSDEEEDPEPPLAWGEGPEWDVPAWVSSGAWREQDPVWAELMDWEARRDPEPGSA